MVDRRQRYALSALLFIAASFSVSAQETLDDCEAMVRDDAGALSSYLCFVQIPRKQPDAWDAARLRLEGYVATDPENHIARLALAALESSQGRDRAEELFLESAVGLKRQGRVNESVRARINLAVFLFIRARNDEAEEQLALAWRDAEAIDDELLLTRVLNIQGRAASQRNETGRAWRIYKEVESRLFPDGPKNLQAFCLSMLGVLAERMGRLDQAIDYQRRAAQIQHDIGDLWSEARARSNIVAYATTLWSEREISRDEALALAREGLDAAVAAGTRDGEGRVRVHLSGLLSGREAVEQLDSALVLLRETRDATGIGMALRARALARIDEPDAQADVDEALDLATRTGARNDVARALMVRAAIHRAQGRADPALADLEAAVESIEASRDLQKDDLVRSRVFAQWVAPYQRWVGSILEAAGPVPSREDLQRAIAVGERMRARALLDALDRARATAALAPAGELTEQRDALLDAISEVQRLLLDPEISESQRRSSLVELERLELEEQKLRERLADSAPDFGALRRPRFPSLDEVQQALTESQALLTFQMATLHNVGSVPTDGPWGGGSWLMVVTRHEVRVHALPDRLDVEPAVKVLAGLIARRQELEIEPAAELHDLLLEPALRELPEGVDELILVPDGALHQLAFSVLGQRGSGENLGSRFALTRVPSATAWLAFSRGAARPTNRPVLVLADPLLPRVESSRSPADEESSDLATRARLGPLPHARREARRIERRLGRGTRLLIGKEASERRLKHETLRDFGMLHFATHALLDDEHPPRSAILLAPGAEDEDGLLQIRDVVALDVEGSVVVLSACRSASGTVLRGEGVMGLARGFFQAGASAVVGSLWPLRDDEAAVFFDGFYERLAGGASLSVALRDTRRERMLAGAPASAWAGVILLGDGSLAPIAPRRGPARMLLGMGFVLVVIVIAVQFRRRRRRPVPQ